jgi:hypothetical protein
MTDPRKKNNIDPEDAYWRMHEPPADKDDELYADEHGIIEDDEDQYLNNDDN